MPGRPLIEIDPELQDRVLHGIDDLTPRETDVLMLSLAGHSHKEIAALLGLSKQHVNNTWPRVRERLGVSSLVQAGVYIATIEAEQKRRTGIVTHF